MLSEVKQASHISTNVSWFCIYAVIIHIHRKKQKCGSREETQDPYVITGAEFWVFDMERTLKLTGNNFTM